MNILFVPSANGFGHVRRSLEVARFLQSRGLGYRLSIVIAPWLWDACREDDVFQSLQVILQAPPAEAIEGPHVHYKISTNISTLLKNFDLIIADGVTWPAIESENVVLIGNFIWEDYYQIQFSLPSNSSPVLERNIRSWVGFEFFAFPSALRVMRILSPIPAYDPLPALQSRGEGKVWLALGRTQDASSRSLLESAKSLDHLEVRETHHLATFEQKPKLVIGRPGFGTIRDCLEYGVPFLPAQGFEQDCELQFNVKALHKLGLLEDIHFQGASLEALPTQELASKWASFGSTRIDRQRTYFSTILEQIQLKDRE